MAMTLTQDDLDAIIAAMNLAPPAVNVTMWAGNATSHTDGTPDVNLKWIHAEGIAPVTLSGYLPVDVSYIDGQDIYQRLRGAIGMAAANLDTQLAAIDPLTAQETADAILLRDWEDVTGTVPDRSTLNALRFLRNKWAASAGTLTVYEEDDTTPAWEAALTTASDGVITGSTPE
jgi:hypothetical protein